MCLPHPQGWIEGHLVFHLPSSILLTNVTHTGSESPISQAISLEDDLAHPLSKSMLAYLAASCDSLYRFHLPQPAMNNSEQVTNLVEGIYKSSAVYFVPKIWLV